MNGCFGGCLGRVAGLVVLAVLIVAAWRFGPDMADRYLSERDSPAREAPTMEAAEAAMNRYQTLVDGRVDRVEFSALELESALHFALADELPEGISNPTIEIRDGELRLGLDIPLDRIPRIPELESVRSVLPERVPVELRGTLLTLEGGEAALLIRRIDASSVPIPRRFHADIARAINPERPPLLPEEAIPVPLPPGVRTIHVEGDRLVATGYSP